ncbi:MAG: ACP phosphodiesterase [Cyclobacteriaceae bacterium]
MNFLAHAYLSFDNQKVLVGNFIGDFVRGNLEENFEREIIIGILLHREIDAFTDRHPLVKEAQDLLKPIFYRYSLVVTDMYFDYFLSKNWNKYDDRPILAYTEKVYAVLEQYREILPEKFLYTFTFMKKENWLASYGTMEGIQRSFTGLSYRTSFDSKIEKAPIYLEKHHDYFEDIFERFFEELIIFSKNKLLELYKKNDHLQT